MQAQDNDRQSKVIRMFNYYDCLESTLISKQKFIYIMNKQANIHVHHNFSPSIIEEIWGQAETTSTGDSSVYTISKIYSQAMKIFQDRISQIEKPTGLQKKQEQLSSQQKKLKQLESQQQDGYAPNYDRINITRKNIATIENKIQQLNKIKTEFKRDLQEMNCCLKIGEKLPLIQKTEYFVQSRLEESLSPPAPSPHLRLIFQVSVLAVFLQMFLLNFHESFLALLCYFLVIYWLFLGYYDQYFVKMIIIGITLSCILDIVYICLEMLGKIGVNRYSSQQKIWLYVSTVILVIEIAIRILLVIKLCIFREPIGKREYFLLFDQEIELNTRSGKLFSSQTNRD